MFVSCTDSINKGKIMNEKMIAIKEFLTEQTDSAKKILRDHRAKATGLKRDFSLQRNCALAYFDGAKYKTVEGVVSDRFSLKSFYIGKKGDVIFSFTSPRFANTPDCRVEIKSEMAFRELPLFGNELFNIFESAIEKRVDDLVELEYARIKASKALALEELETIRKEKAAKYAGKLSYGAW